MRAELMTCAEALHDVGAELITARFHDHGEVFGLPALLRRPLAARIETVNRIYDEIHATYGGIRLDLATRPEIRDAGVLVGRPAAPVGAWAIAPWPRRTPSCCTSVGCTSTPPCRAAGGWFPAQLAHATSPGWWPRVRRGWAAGPGTSGPGPPGWRSEAGARSGG